MKRNFLVWAFLPGFFTVLSSAQVDISPGVARISLIQGDVSVQRGDTGDWAAAALNQPLVGGDRISTGDGSQAELQLDHSNILRLGNNAHAKIATLERTEIERTQIDRAQIDRAQIQVQVGQGRPTSPRPRAAATWRWAKPRLYVARPTRREACSAARLPRTAGIPGTTTATEKSATLNRGTTPTDTTWGAR